MRVRICALLLSLGGILGACLPNPQSVRERREEFPRDGLRGELIFKSTPPGMTEVGAVFGKQAKLLGHTLEPQSPKPGDRVKITFYWTAISSIAEDYQVFVHGDAVGAKASRIHGDHYPAKGKYPTDVWQKGEVVADPFIVWIPPGYGPKHLGIFIGLYKNKYRVPLTDKGKAYGTSDNRSRAVDIYLR